MEKIETLDKVLEGLMGRYSNRVPNVKRIVNAMIDKGMVESINSIQNDHIAFRTMGVKNLGITSFERIFLALGYTKKDYLRFENKKLNAYWYAPPENRHPRIFVSELCVDELSDETQNLVKKYTDVVTSDPVDKLNLDNWQEIDTFLHSPLWEMPSFEDYKKLEAESEYASWVIYNRYYLNHFTISVHTLPKDYNTCEKFNIFLENLGIKLNDSGGKIKVSADRKLLQSASSAEMIEAEFRNEDGSIRKEMISGSYVEFAERKVLDEFSHLKPDDIKREHRRDGFEAGNADKIFESTYKSQTEK